MTNILLIVSIVIHIFSFIYISQLKKYISEKIRQSDTRIAQEQSHLQEKMSILCDNLDRYYGDMAGKLHCYSTILGTDTGNKRKRK
jgi:hypothetical protein